MDATVLYGYFSTFWDNGVEPHKFSEVLNHLQFGMNRFEEALAILNAMNLVDLYQQEKGYLIFIKPTLANSEFLSHPAYRRLLEKKIGDFSVKQFEMTISKSAKNLSKRFWEVFSDMGDVVVRPKEEKTFALEHFQKRMQQDGLQFLHEKEDVLALYKMAEHYQMNWFDLYELAKETAHHSVIHTKRMIVHKEKISIKNLESFSEHEKTLLIQAKMEKPDILLAQIKKGRRATVTADELSLLDELVQMSFLDEVINVMIIYTMAKVKSANLNKKYLMKIANDFAYQKVSSAETAIEILRQLGEQRVEQKLTRQSTSNIPEWSQADYKNETNQDEQVRLEEFKRQALAKLEGDK